MAFFPGVQTVQLALMLILGYRFLEFIKETFTDMNKLVDDIEKGET